MWLHTASNEILSDFGFLRICQVLIHFFSCEDSVSYSLYALHGLTYIQLKPPTPNYSIVLAHLFLLLLVEVNITYL